MLMMYYKKILKINRNKKQIKRRNKICCFQMRKKILIKRYNMININNSCSIINNQQNQLKNLKIKLIKNKNNQNNNKFNNKYMRTCQTQILWIINNKLNSSFKQINKKMKIYQILILMIIMINWLSRINLKLDF